MLLFNSMLEFPDIIFRFHIVPRTVIRNSKFAATEVEVDILPTKLSFCKNKNKKQLIT